MCQLPRGCVVFVLQEESILIGWAHKESDTTEQPANTHTHTHTHMHAHTCTHARTRSELAYFYTFNVPICNCDIP